MHVCAKEIVPSPHDCLTLCGGPAICGRSAFRVLTASGSNWMYTEQRREAQNGNPGMIEFPLFPRILTPLGAGAGKVEDPQYQLRSVGRYAA